MSSDLVDEQEWLTRKKRIDVSGPKGRGRSAHRSQERASAEFAWAPDGRHIAFTMTAEDPPTIPVPASLVRAKRCTDGWYEVGALFRLPALRKSFPEMQI